MCPGCGTFTNVQQQRSHFRSLWHRYNLVVRQHNLRAPGAKQAPLVSREELDQMCASLDRDAENQDIRDDADTADELTALIRRLDLSGSGSMDSKDSDEHVDAAALSAHVMSDALRSPMWWYETAPNAPTQLEQTQLGIYRDVLLAAAPSGESAPPSRFLSALTTPRLDVRPGTCGWSGKHVQGTQHVGRSMQMHVLDGTGLVPWLSKSQAQDQAEEEGDDEDDEDEEATDSDTMSSMSTASSEILSDSAPMQSQPQPSLDNLPPLRLWTFVMMGGGHFAVATIALNLHVLPLSERAKARGSKPQRSVIVLAHKTFHRYTTRRKQGGSQAAQDSTGRHAKSAGANLRRYGEAQLTHDIHQLLNRRAWRDLIARSEHVWVRASMRSAHGVLWHWPGHASSPLDEKQALGALSHIPIATQRPTMSEILRCFFELTRIKVAHLTPEELAAQDDAHREAVARALRASDAQQHARPRVRTREQEGPSHAQKKGEKKESRVRERWERLVTMVRRGKIDALTNFLTRHQDLLESARCSSLTGGAGDRGDGSDGNDAAAGSFAYVQAKLIDVPLPSWWRESEARSSRTIVPTTLLQLAAAADQPDMVHYLLVEQRADPTLPVLPLRPESMSSSSSSSSAFAHRTAYDLCGGKASRTVFRRVMAEQPDWYAWDEMGVGGARVPSALTAEMQEAQSSKARTRRAAMREKMRERESKAEKQEAPAEAPAPEPAASAPTSTLGHLWQRLGGSSASPSVPMDDASLSDEMRRRIEREKRARAAEARMQKLK